MTDIIARIDSLVAEPEAHCWQCHRHLDGATEDGFCSERCQAAWHTTGQRLIEARRPPTREQLTAFESELADLNTRKASSTPALRRSWSCAARGHLWSTGTRVTRCTACRHPLLPWHTRARTRLLTRWNWWRGNARRIARTIRRRQP